MVEDHVTLLSEALEGLTVALTATFLPTETETTVLSRETPVTAFLTVTLHFAETSVFSAVAVIVTVPFLIPVTTPYLSTVAIFSSEEVQITFFVVVVSGSRVVVKTRVLPILTLAFVLLSLTAVAG